MAQDPAVTVVLVSDFEPPGAKRWDDEHAALHALAAQDIKEPFEVILVVDRDVSDQMPPTLLEIVSDLQVVVSDDIASPALKDEGVQRARGDFIAIVETDCEPAPDWLRIFVGVLRTHPDVSAVSGRTIYGTETVWHRALSLLDRSYEDLGHAGRTIHLSNNAALFRRDVLREFSCRDVAVPFLFARVRERAICGAGHVLYFEPQAVVRHEFGGWPFIRDFRRNMGFADIAHHGDLRLAVVPGMVLNRIKSNLGDCLRVGRKYLKWYDWPLTLVLLVVARVLELPGMVDALKRRPEVPGTAWR